ncbi:protein of unknown function [Paraburkholderia dioscoreae]|uniref:Uncharacterized protein n=1 Tax=Paraburkholderia dioscoreae TaxID=2604047 RepID=A0A5Q4ZNE9_9BURK|nr:protein of unknown function [Paraburkholderia dioscoreae]
MLLAKSWPAHLTRAWAESWVEKRCARAGVVCKTARSGLSRQIPMPGGARMHRAYKMPTQARLLVNLAVAAVSQQMRESVRMDVPHSHKTWLGRT